MGVARLLAKAWIAFCFYSFAHAVAGAVASSTPLPQALQAMGLCTALFGAMGLLFVGGYAASATHSGMGALAKLRARDVLPGFDELVFLAFAALVFAVQIAYAPLHGNGPVVAALDGAIAFAVPGQHALEATLTNYGLDGGRSASSAFAWLLAFIFLGSALSRARMQAALVRLERKGRPEILGASGLVFLLGIVAVAAIQLLFMGTAYEFIPCWILAAIPGAVLIGLGPLMLAYLIKAAITDLLALGPEG
ncbi:MAG TPA: hypothetical protein VN154_02440 [Rhizomicrobium sp.]|nr:hypothetical protein [Rhizomicrobium sp.]